MSAHDYQDPIATWAAREILISSVKGVEVWRAAPHLHLGGGSSSIQNNFKQFGILLLSLDGCLDSKDRAIGGLGTHYEQMNAHD